MFACYDSMWDTIYHSEVGASKAVLDAGYTLDSLMLRYKNVDWRNQSNWGCNGECVPQLSVLSSLLSQCCTLCWRIAPLEISCCMRTRCSARLHASGPD